MDLASAYVLRLLNHLVLDFEVCVGGGMSRSLEYSGPRNDGEDLESKRCQDLDANLASVKCWESNSKGAGDTSRKDW